MTLFESTSRLACYAAAKDPNAERAERDLFEWRAARSSPFGAGLIERR
jgi:hypothetical protein